MAGFVNEWVPISGADGFVVRVNPNARTATGKPVGQLESLAPLVDAGDLTPVEVKILRNPGLIVRVRGKGVEDTTVAAKFLQSVEGIKPADGECASEKFFVEGFLGRHCRQPAKVFNLAARTRKKN